MTKAQFTPEDIAQAVETFVSSTPSRSAPAVGKNSDVTIYGDNPNPYKPVIIKETEDEPSEAISGPDIGIEFGGDD